MTQARIVGCSLKVSKTEKYMDRCGEIYISRTFQDQPESWSDRAVDPVVVRQAMFQHHQADVGKAARMFTAPMDFADLNMVPIGVLDGHEGHYVRFPDSGSITGYMTGCAASAGRAHTSVKFDFCLT